MKIYVAMLHYDYEGASVLGIFETQEAAKECCQGEQNDRPWNHLNSQESLEWFHGYKGWAYAKSTDEYPNHSYEVEAHEVMK